MYHLLFVYLQIQEGGQTPKSPHVRGSYTLDHPSPALMASHATDIALDQDRSQGQIEVKGQGQMNALNDADNSKVTTTGFTKEKPKGTLTSSMEDLNIRPHAHRRLDYQGDQPANHDPEPLTSGQMIADNNMVANSGNLENLKVTPLPNETEPSYDSSQQFRGQQIQGHHFEGQHFEGQHFEGQPPGVSRYEGSMPFDVLQQDQREAERSGKQEHLLVNILFY